MRLALNHVIGSEEGAPSRRPWCLSLFKSVCGRPFKTIMMHGLLDAMAVMDDDEKAFWKA